MIFIWINFLHQKLGTIYTELGSNVLFREPGV